MTCSIPRKSAPLLSLMAMCAFFGPGLGPIIGGFLTEHSGWEYILWFNHCFAASVSATWWLPQTMLNRKARELRKRTGVDGLYTEVQRNGLPKSRTFIAAVWRPLQLLAFEPVVFLTSLFVSFIWGILYIYLGAYIVVFRTRYGWGEAKVGAAFGGVAMGILLAGNMAGMANKIFVKSSEKDGKGRTFPEGCLPPAMLAAVLVPVSPITSGIPFGWCIVMLFVMSVGAASSLLRCLFAMSFPLVTPKLYERFGPEWVETILASITLLFIRVPFLFWRYGSLLRSKSKFQSRFL
ncbi:major facilitator superfamily domain-containing protein [Tuber brumale]|nr:major facilitator superfamily domain-containing protein [Tuber brumale]